MHSLLWYPATGRILSRTQTNHTKVQIWSSIWSSTSQKQCSDSSVQPKWLNITNRRLAGINDDLNIVTNQATVQEVQFTELNVFGASTVPNLLCPTVISAKNFVPIMKVCVAWCKPYFKVENVGKCSMSILTSEVTSILLSLMFCGWRIEFLCRNGGSANGNTECGS